MPEVVDIGDPMTKVMVGTVENRLFKPLNEIMRRQLDPIWHSLGKKTKQLVSNLEDSLRKLLDYLERYLNEYAKGSVYLIVYHI
ncbi:DNA repair endonuclease UVH1-like [Ziziphus jujuba]|uniref:DNA repair endonuclease UVH1-like n=1 Tax=Ziziphus jujuba TaxID=326968 RepID=A0ABM4ABG1_ZIZJJ|nr:DNA repair endonuclease UVH1-like [Ziziphus jujuba]